jgi:hypothetical protein
LSEIALPQEVGRVAAREVLVTYLPSLLMGGFAVALWWIAISLGSATSLLLYPVRNGV